MLKRSLLNSLVLFGLLLTYGSAYSSYDKNCAATGASSYNIAIFPKTGQPQPPYNDLLQFYVTWSYPNGHSYKDGPELLTQYGSTTYCVEKENFNQNDPRVTLTITDSATQKIYYQGTFLYLNSTLFCNGNGTKLDGLHCVIGNSS